MPVVAMKRHECELTQSGATNLNLGDNVFARVNVTTQPTKEGGVLLCMAVALAEGKPPTHDDDRLLTGFDFRTQCTSTDEALAVAAEFVRQRLEQNIQFMTVVTTEQRTES